MRHQGAKVRDGTAPAVLDAVVKSSSVEIVVVIGERRIAIWTSRRERARQPRLWEPSARAFADVAEEEEQRIAEIGG